MKRHFRTVAGRPARPAILLLFPFAAAAALALTAAPATAQPAGASGPFEAALREARISNDDVRDFYRARSFRPLWVAGGRLGPEADALLRLIETAEADGLDSDDYRPRALAEAVGEARSGAPEALARAEVLLSRRFAQYVRNVRRPRDSSGMEYAERTLAPVRPTMRAVLDEAAAAPALLGHLENAGWMHPIYGGLRRALSVLPRGDAADIRVPLGPLLRPGASGERVRLLRRRLGLDGDGDYDARLVQAVRDFQAAQGLPRDGVAGPLTLAALNRSSADVRRILRLNLDRARALPADPGRRYVLVDAAAARLYVYENGRVRDTMRVVVGRVTDPTPMIAGLIRFATLNPYWNVPPDLAATRVAPHAVRGGPAYLRAAGYEVLSDWTASARIVDPATVDWAGVAAGRQEVRMRQRPGPENAMGRIKLSFPNRYGVYLHDTPDRDLLRETARTFSAGCVRVEDAPRLARWLFGRNLSTRSRTPEQHFVVPEPVPVYITYLTAAPEGDTIAFREDVYGRDGARQAAN